MLIRGYPLTKDNGRFSAAPLDSKLMPEVFKKSHKLPRSSKVLEERMLGDIGCKILGVQAAMSPPCTSPLAFVAPGLPLK